ncbi:MAG: molybdopterin-synthase adenylyltransferase MoeB [Paracoccaceae bacterium]
MVLALALAAVIWGGGALLSVPVRLRLIGLGLLYLAIVLSFFLLPDGAAVFGGSLYEWLFLGVLAILVLGYSRVLAALKCRATPQKSAANTDGFSNTELDRNARHIVLRDIGGPGQKRLKAARVLVIGAGGLGAPALQYLAAAGVGTVGVIDDDVVENSNLARQVIHKDDAIGMPKVFSAQAEMQAQNPHITVRPYNRRLEADMAGELFKDYDLVLDGCDNFDTRYLVNRTCVALKIPLIGAALSQWEGQISSYHPASGGPCYACIFPNSPAPGLAPSCAEGGVLGPLPGVVGAMMAVEAVKLIAGAGEGLVGRMLIYDALYGENRALKMKRDPKCKVCAQIG